MWDEPKAKLRWPMQTLMRPHERCCSLETAGRWPWKSESAKECVTTHRPKRIALKMDAAKASYPYFALRLSFEKQKNLKCRKACRLR